MLQAAVTSFKEAEARQCPGNSTTGSGDEALRLLAQHGHLEGDDEVNSWSMKKS
jgi:hypothetical protein